MSKKLILIALFAVVSLGLYSQRPTLELTFTAINNSAYVQLDSIKVMNRTQGGDNVLYWPDTTLTLGITPGDLLLCIGYAKGSPSGVQEINQEKTQFQLFQNYPNPVKDQSVIPMYIPEKGNVNVMVTDLTGRLIIATERNLDKGNHSFRFSPCDGTLFFLTVWWNGISRSIKILTTGENSGERCALDYTGNGNGKPPLKTASLKNSFVVKESGILDAPDTNETYTFQFATNIPCPGTPTVTYEAQVYNTIQIFSQCWIKENLNVGTMIPGIQDMSNNSVIEKYCYNNEVDSCTKYGGFYQWNEIMQYTATLGVQGICPPGWHIPTDEEWKVLEGSVDIQYGIGDSLWDDAGLKGFDAGLNLKSTSGWYLGGNGTDLFGFSGLPGGNRYPDGSFDGIGDYGVWWSASEFDTYNAWYRNLGYNKSGVDRYLYGKPIGFGVRCLRD